MAGHRAHVAIVDLVDGPLRLLAHFFRPGAPGVIPQLNRCGIIRRAYGVRPRDTRELAATLTFPPTGRVRYCHAASIHRSCELILVRYEPALISRVDYRQTERHAPDRQPSTVNRQPSTV